MADRVYGIDLVLTIEIGVKAVHHHRQFLPFGVFRAAQHTRRRNGRKFGVARRIRIDHEKAVHALVHVPFQWQGMAMVEVAAEGLGIEFVNELLARIDQPGALNAVHPRRVNAVKMHGMRV